MEDPGVTAEKLLCKFSKKFAFNVVDDVVCDTTDVTGLWINEKLDAYLVKEPTSNNIIRNITLTMFFIKPLYIARL